MEGKTWLAVALCCFIWFGYMKWFAPLPPSPVAATTATSLPQGGAVTAPGTSPTTAAAPGSVFGADFAPTASTRLANAAKEITFSTEGGKILDVALLQYPESVQPNAAPIKLFSSSGTNYNLATVFTASELADLGTGTYVLEKKPDSVTFVRRSSKAEVRKTYSLEGDSHFVNLSVEVTFLDSARRDWGFLSIPVGMANPTFDHNEPLKAWETVYFQNDSLSRINGDSIAGEKGIKQGNTHWLAFGNRYFSSVLLNESELNPDVVVQAETGFSGASLRYPLVLKDGQKSLLLKLKLYLGPKDYDQLAKVPSLKQLIDYGFFSFFAYPLLELLRFFYKFVHNFGIAIILLTLVVRALFYPLSVKSYQSMKAMQKLQPQIQALKEKYKDDMQRFSQEQMALFKTHKVNPMGGCLPMLVQLPVFIALYAVLGNSIELFHAPFYGWIYDLSSKDPFYVYPVLMGLSMLAQTKLTPTVGADPMQQKMMYLMPVVFTFIMLNLPSGLTLYIFVSTVLGILQQWIMMRDPGTQQATPQTIKS